MTDESIKRTGGALAARLQDRQPEICDLLMARAAGEATYDDELHRAFSAAVSYGIDLVGAQGDEPPSVPEVLLKPARIAARAEVPLKTVLRRYVAGFSALADCIVEESQNCEGDRDGAELRRLLGAQASLIDQLLDVVCDEYEKEAELLRERTERRCDRLVHRLLKGDPIDTSAIEYEFDCYHVGVVTTGRKGATAMQRLSAELGCRLLELRSHEQDIWAWIGSRQRIDPTDVANCVGAVWSGKLVLAIGEPARGLSGWRLTHRQARAAFPIAERSGAGRTTRYADVALLAAVLRDDLFATSLQELYLAPLERERDGGAAARETLRAYIEADRNVSSAAARLGVNRNTVTNRLRTIEGRLGRQLSACRLEVEAALHLAQLDTENS